MGFRLPHQQQLILQQPNGLIWMRVCAKLRIFPTLQQVHQYDAALKLVTDDGHKASEEIYTCIVSEQHKHLMQQKQQQQAVSVSKQRLTAVMASKAPLTAPPPLVSHTYGERSYSVCSMSPPMPLANCPYLSLQDGSQYAGEFKEGKFHGVGTFKFAIGGYYSGQWFATQRAHMCTSVSMLRLIATQGSGQEAWQRCHAVRFKWQVEQRAVLLVRTPTTLNSSFPSI
jgi:hypothetical protein